MSGFLAAGDELKARVPRKPHLPMYILDETVFPSLEIPRTFIILDTQQLSGVNYVCSEDSKQMRCDYIISSKRQGEAHDSKISMSVEII